MDSTARYWRALIARHNGDDIDSGHLLQLARECGRAASVSVDLEHANRALAWHGTIARADEIEQELLDARQQHGAATIRLEEAQAAVKDLTDSRAMYSTLGKANLRHLAALRDVLESR